MTITINYRIPYFEAKLDKAGVIRTSDVESGTNTKVGSDALAASSGASAFNTAYGYRALYSNTTETYSTGIGANALKLSTGHANTGVGAGAGSTITTGLDSVALGADALGNVDGGDSTTGTNNVALGVHAGGHITSGEFNVFVGNYSGVGGGAYTGVPSALLTGSYNTGIGHFSLGGVTGAAAENVAVGYYSGKGVTTGGQNIFVGPYAGRNTTTGSLNIVIGRDVQTSAVGASNELNIGNLIRGAGLSQGGAPSTGRISIGLAALPSASAVLELYATDKGFLPPRMSTAEKNAIASPATGLMVFDQNLAKLCVYTGSAWQTITSV